MERILITGANRGIGFELVRQYVADGDVRVFAACRHPDRAEQLNALTKHHAEQVRMLQLDINDSASIDAAVKTLEAEVAGLDLLINNAGIFPKGEHQSRNLGALSADDLAEVIMTNSVGPLMVTQACRHLLKKGNQPRVVMISSAMGSLGAASGGSYAYRMSKAAMNMAARVLAQDSAMSGIVTVTTHPGWVQTDMGGSAAALTVQESASGLKKLISGLTPADQGKFYRWDGLEHIW